MTHFRQQVLAQVTSELGPDRTPAWGGQGEDTGGNGTGQRLCGVSEPDTRGRQSGQSVQLTARGRALGTGRWVGPGHGGKECGSQPSARGSQEVWMVSLGFPQSLDAQFIHHTVAYGMYTEPAFAVCSQSGSHDHS